MKRRLALICALALLLLGSASNNPIRDIQVAHQLLREFRPWHGDVEAPAERDARLGIIATASVIAGEGNRERIIGLLVQAKSETNLAAHIHRGECEGHPKSFHGECDAIWIKQHGRRVRVHRARNVWQVHTAPREDLARLWGGALGADLAATTNAAKLADYLLQARRCGGDIAKQYSAQGGIGCYATPSGLKRAALHRRLRARWAEVEAGL